MADPTLKTALADPKLRPVVLAWAARIQLLDEVQFIVDMLQKKEARQIYRDYIAEDAPKAINLSRPDLLPIRELVARGKFKPTELRSLLVDATEKQFRWIQVGMFENSSTAFVKSKEYKQYLSATLTRNPNVATALGALTLSEAKAKQLEPLLETYYKARTPTDAYQAYLLMVKIVSKSALEPALLTGGKPITDVIYWHKRAQAEEKTQQLAAANAQKAVKLVPTITKEVKDANDYLTTALKTAKDKAKMKAVSGAEVTRMFNSGRMRVQQAATSWTNAVRLDPKFSTKFPTVAANKKQMDEAWAEYRKALGK